MLLLEFILPLLKGHLNYNFHLNTVIMVETKFILTY